MSARILSTTHKWERSQLTALRLSVSSSFADDHFIDVTTADANQITHLYVYATDANGAPQSSPTQKLYAKGLTTVQMIPKPILFTLSTQHPSAPTGVR